MLENCSRQSTFFVRTLLLPHTSTVPRGRIQYNKLPVLVKEYSKQVETIILRMYGYQDKNEYSCKFQCDDIKTFLDIMISLFFS